MSFAELSTPLSCATWTTFQGSTGPVDSDNSLTRGYSSFSTIHRAYYSYYRFNEKNRRRRAGQTCAYPS